MTLPAFNLNKRNDEKQRTTNTYHTKLHLLLLS